jgi:hypothetical protein
MKIKKNGKVINLTESEIKEIVKQYKIKSFLSEDRQSRRSLDRSKKVESIIAKMKELTNILNTTESNLESISTYNRIEEFLEKTIEDFEDKINKKETKKES